jgi:multisubunit Na+/H+ antiporter MnhF subunit
MIVAFASISGTAYILDFAIIYALFGFIGTIFLALFLQNKAEEDRK